MTVLILLFAAACASALLTGLVRRYAISAKLLDHPNARSSHTLPTPRGGGVAIVFSFLLVCTVLAVLGWVPRPMFWLFGLSAALVALVGFVDDRKPLPARWRFLAHMAGSIGCVVALGVVLPPVPMLGWQVDLGWFGVALAASYITWMINLYNFMDGIDGLASVEAISVALGGALCWWLATGTSMWAVPALFAACVAGFLAWNFPPAKIFMGDAGSGFLGLVLGFLSLWAAFQAPAVYWSWFILTGVFMVDATTTLVRRVRRGERFNEAHRNHAYQYASRKHGSHKRITMAVAAINTLWLLPLAVAVALGKLDGLATTIVAYIPLVALAFRYKAGDRAHQEV
ncbi:glycosyltransferase family 4 protein [Rhizobacter sp. J219]|uniref:MraY family glycosyltransferase n=1 Tax=Rhizobacter sp. J219 TaxID=2898430 RepID=UPI002151F645|nr:glycosyltransferase family 4 protein [Rhizobacter sp. J219]MCR5885703.1 glycosyltransferase family 4 protein [Rhizobacter sp. J219]